MKALVTKIYNTTTLDYKEIGTIIDMLNKRIDTQYIGKISYYEFEVNYKKVCVQTEIQKTQFKIYFWEKR